MEQQTRSTQQSELIQQQLEAKLYNYESNHNNHIWVKSIDDEDLLFKFVDPNIKEERDPKKIKDEQIFTKTSQTQKIIKFVSLKQKALKEATGKQILDTDIPVFVGSTHNQYGVIRKVMKPAGPEQQLQYEVRLSTTLENVVVQPSDLKRMISINFRVHVVKGTESQIFTVHVRIDSSIQQLL